MPLTAAQNRHLRSRAHHLKPVVMVGQHGLNEFRMAARHGCRVGGNNNDIAFSFFHQILDPLREIRDAETATISVQAALTGHRVLSTVHTNDAAGAITRFLDMGIEPFLVSSVMLVSIAQRLVRKVCPYCAKPYKPAQKALEYWGLDKVEGANFMQGTGCFNCMDKGYKGRTGVFEILIIDDMVQDMILQRKSSQEIARAAIAAGNLKTLKDDAAKKVIQGITSLEEAASAVIV